MLLSVHDSVALLPASVLRLWLPGFVLRSRFPQRLVSLHNFHANHPEPFAVATSFLSEPQQRLLSMLAHVWPSAVAHWLGLFEALP